MHELGFRKAPQPPCTHHACNTLQVAAQVLVVDHNSLTSLPASLPSLTKLERLNASSNQLTNVGAIQALVSLKQLNLSHNHLTALSSSIAESTALQELEVSNNGLQVRYKRCMAPGAQVKDCV